MSAAATLQEINLGAIKPVLHATSGATVRTGMRQTLRVVNTNTVTRNACDVCALNAICMPEGLAQSERQEFASLVLQHKRLHAGQSLYRAGEPFSQLYFVKAGAFKTVVLLDDGREQITGFHFAGDVLGIDAISSPNHPSEAIALEDASVCAMPFAQLTRLSQRVEHLQSYVQRLLAREVVRDQGLMLLLGRMNAEERVAAFLMNLSSRFRARQLSALEFTLPMVREEIGNYLGLTLETVSRCFSKFKNTGVLEVVNRQIRIRNIEALKGVIGGGERAATGKAAGTSQGARQR